MAVSCFELLMVHHLTSMQLGLHIRRNSANPLWHLHLLRAPQLPRNINLPIIARETGSLEQPSKYTTFLHLKHVGHHPIQSNLQRSHNRHLHPNMDIPRHWRLGNLPSSPNSYIRSRVFCLSNQPAPHNANLRIRLRCSSIFRLAHSYQPSSILDCSHWTRTACNALLYPPHCR